MSLFFENEKVLIEAKRHPFYFYAQISFVLLLAILPLIFYSFFHQLSSEITSLNLMAFLFFLYFLFLVFIWIYIFVTWTDYFVDAWIITNHRVIDYELKGLFNQDIASVNFENIQDVKVIISGFIQHWIKAGDIHIQTAGSTKEFVIIGIREPDKIKEKIFEAINEHKKNKIDNNS